MAEDSKKRLPDSEGYWWYEDNGVMEIARVRHWESGWWVDFCGHGEMYSPAELPGAFIRPVSEEPKEAHLAEIRARNEERRRKWQPMKSAAYGDVLVGVNDVDALFAEVEHLKEYPRLMSCGHPESLSKMLPVLPGVALITCELCWIKKELSNVTAERNQQFNEYSERFKMMRAALQLGPELQGHAYYEGQDKDGKSEQHKQRVTEILKQMEEAAKQ